MIRGDASAFVRALDNVRKTVDELGHLPRKLAVAASPDITALLLRQYDSGTDPYGRAWRPLRPSTIRTGRQNPPLTATGRLRDGTVARPSPGNRAAMRVVVGASYGAFPQIGFRAGRTMVAPRRILPSHGMPSAWRNVFARRARELAREAARV